MSLRPIPPLAALGFLALCGCVTVFPKTTPAQLYRFEAHPASAARPAANAPAFTVRRSDIDFDPASRGERLLTVRGHEVAYIGDARWAIPASELFEEAIDQGFEASAGPARLLPPGRSATAKDRLHIDVTRFEVRYGAAAAPTVVVRLDAELTREGDLSEIATKAFDAEVPASANRVSAIVDAYGVAVTKVVGDLVAWVDGAGA
jgi:cholesterol transport system auxiliary component